MLEACAGRNRDDKGKRSAHLEAYTVEGKMVTVRGRNLAWERNHIREREDPSQAWEELGNGIVNLKASQLLPKPNTVSVKLN